MRFLCLLLIPPLAGPLFVIGDDGESHPKLAATLQPVQKTDQSLKSAVVRLTVENVGNSRITLLRLRAGQLEALSSWYGWEIAIKGPAGRYGFNPHPGVPAPPSDDDLIDLAPGESFGLLINIGQAEPLQPAAQRAGSSVSQTKGDFTVSVSYTPNKKDWFHIKRKDISLISVRSAPVKVIVEK